ncbi:MAG: hypothetical protein H7Y27_11945 [Gemmatimonadaceae bacterium]|nr:hypothetical protein [Chitinophagaceae bacterium]
MPASAQLRLRGTVYDMSRTQTLPGVSVLSTSGLGTSTDSAGNYLILVRETDSVWFSYLNKPTPKYPVRAVYNPNGFDIALHVPVTELKEVRIMPRNYKFDSAQNRQDYAKIFDYRKPGLRISAPQSGGFGVGLDLDELINVFRFKRNRRLQAFQDRLLQEEQDKFIDHRFTKALIRKITDLSGPSMDQFMKEYRPSYEFTQYASDYEFAEYIQLAWREYVQRRR